MIGGPAAQALASNGTSWSCSLTVAPVTSGFQDIQLTVAYAASNEGVFAAIPVAASPIGVIRPVQGRSSNIQITYTPGGPVGEQVVADLSQIQAADKSASLTLTGPDDEGTWRGTVDDLTPPDKGLKTLAVSDGTTVASTTVGVLDPNLLYGDWLFVMWDETFQGDWAGHVDSLVNGILATHIPVVLLDVRLWDWWANNFYYETTQQRRLEQSQSE